MKKIVLLMLLFSVAVSCGDQPTVKNQTRKAGYAIGENVKLAFTVSGTKTAPDSLEVAIFEKKTGYIYKTFASPVAAQDNNRYECVWNGRKPDGSWPAGGRYWVYADIPESNVVSDTVEIGLTD